MGKKILFSPVGTTDPIRNSKDGSMLHICRVYEPDIVYLYLSAEMLELHELDDRYEYCIRRLGEKSGHMPEIRYIKRPDLKDVQVYDTFYEDFYQIISDIRSEMEDDDELIVNIASGTPAMKSALLVLSVIMERQFKAIQVTTPMNRSNQGERKYDAAANWESDQDNEAGFSVRCKEVEDRNFTAMIKLDSIRKFIKSYDYHAAWMLAQEIRTWISPKSYSLLELAYERLMLNVNTANVNRLLARINEDIFPLESGRDCLIFEYALSTQVKLKKKEYADFIRALTPLVTELMEWVLKKQCKINIDDYCEKDKKGVKRFDNRKLKGSEVSDALNKKFKGGVKESFVSVAHTAPLIQHFSKDRKLQTTVQNIADVEQKVRNMAAHNIISVSAEWIKNKTEYTPEQIFEMVKYLIGMAGIRVDNSAWKSYEAMNDLILKELNS